jgi:hypothetical protein
MRFAADCEDERPDDDSVVDAETLVSLERSALKNLVNTYLGLVVSRCRSCLLIVLVVDGGALKGGFEVCDVGHVEVEMQAGATGGKQYSSK